VADANSLIERKLRLSEVQDEETWAALLRNVCWIDPNIIGVRRSYHEPDVLYVQYSGTEIPALVIRSIEEAGRDIAKLCKRVPQRVVFEYGTRGSSQKDHLVDLKGSGSLALVDGALVASGLLLLLMQGIDRELLRFARRLNAKEFEFGSTLPLAAAKRCGILDNYPHQAYFLSNLRCGIDQVKKLRSIPSDELERFDWPAAISDPNSIMAPAICYHYWRSIQEGGSFRLPIEIGTAVGRCFRFELPAPPSPYRLREFKMREVFAVGLPKAVNDIRRESLQYLQNLLAAWKLSGQVQTAWDPFFVDQYAAKRMLQLGSELKLELQVWLPFDGQSIAVASVNDHLDFFARNYEVPDQMSGTLTSCCVAFGIERLALAIVGQHGIDPEIWPEELRRLVEDD
jgi:hypothetical protein